MGEKCTHWFLNEPNLHKQLLTITHFADFLLINREFLIDTYPI